MKHSLQLRLSQHLTLTPQLQQSIRLLQLSTLELNQELERILQENPLLERDDDSREQAVAGAETAARAADPEPATEAPATDGPAAETDGAEASALDEAPPPGYRDDGEDGEHQQIAAEAPSLRAHLLSQIALTNLSGRDHQLVALLIDSLNDDGYLTQSLEELAALVPAELEVDLDELQIALKHLQHLEPAGVGARSLGECLALQLAILPPDTPYRSEALETARNHLDVLAARDFTRLKKLLRCDDAALRAAQKLITGLNPKP
ncbi:MAG: RNA polymerase factor sigma-54, partial [Burkholderiales bacterium]